jgi:hypothetical protein
MINLDIKYATSKSLWLDLKIMFMTAPALINQVLETHMNRKKAVPVAAAAQVLPVPDSQTSQGNRPQLSAI